MAHRVDTAGNVANLFVDKNPATNTPGTIVDDEWLNSVQEEYLEPIELAGDPLDKAKRDQLAGAIAVRIDNLARLRLQPAPSGGKGVRVLLGYYTPGDGGGGVFRWDSASTSADNGGTIIRPDVVIATDPGRWMRIFSGMVNIRWFGAKTDGTNVSAAVQAAVNAAFALGLNVYAPKGDYAYRDTMFMRSNVHMYGDGEKTYFYPVAGLNTVLGDGIFTTFAAVSRYYASQATHPVTVALRGDYASYVGPHVNIGLHNMRIKGTRQTATGDGGCTIELMDFVGADVNACVVEDGHDAGIRIEGAGDVNPVWTDFDNYTGGFAVDWRIANCKISNSKHAIEIGEQATRGHILDNKCANNLQHGIRLTGGYTVTIRGNRVLATPNTFNDIQLSQSQDLIITGNHLDPLAGNATVEEAIRVLQVRRVQMFGNEITKGGVIYNSSLVSENVRVWGNQYHNGTSRPPADLVQLPNAIAPFVRERVPTNNAMTAFVDLAVGGVLAVRAYRSANVTLQGGGTDQQVIFDAEEYDQGGRYDPATGRLMTLSGSIECLMGIRLDVLNLTAGDVIVARAKTAAGVALSQVPFVIDNVSYAWFVAPLTFKVDDGTNVEFFINISGAATDRTLLAGQTTTWLSARMIGGV